jgi:hypothetical protein
MAFRVSLLGTNLREMRNTPAPTGSPFLGTTLPATGPNIDIVGIADRSAFREGASSVRRRQVQATQESAPNTQFP